ncbi:Uncharacterised protein [Yokenella regensburgei]|uniref:Uncharacterized protein n=1 Tax=Yokenella regensburgei TaxID=158877 RepID=A0AB38FVZ0_9ENTR|nr:Uncharacterised protein [Yokenella regensburgei]VFS12947.1 Uncharacterised protein [Yokenella regensburgei]
MQRKHLRRQHSAVIDVTGVNRHRLLAENVALISESVADCCRYPGLAQRIAAVLPLVRLNVQRVTLQQTTIVERLVMQF